MRAATQQRNMSSSGRSARSGRACKKRSKRRQMAVCVLVAVAPRLHQRDVLAQEIAQHAAEALRLPQALERLAGVRREQRQRDPAAAACVVPRAQLGERVGGDEPARRELAQEAGEDADAMHQRRARPDAVPLAQPTLERRRGRSRPARRRPRGSCGASACSRSGSMPHVARARRRRRRRSGRRPPATGSRPHLRSRQVERDRAQVLGGELEIGTRWTPPSDARVRRRSPCAGLTPAAGSPPWRDGRRAGRACPRARPSAATRPRRTTP